MAYQPRHLSVSAVELYAKCPAQWKRRYVDRVDVTTPAMVWGTAFHAALEAGHKGGDIELTWVQAWNEARTNLARRGETLVPPKSHGLDLLGQYVQRGLLRPGKAEVRFSLALPAGNIPVPVLGYIDAVLPDEMREYKTTKGVWWTATKAQLAYQTAVYGWAHQRLYRRRVPMRYVIFGTRLPTITEYVVEHDPDVFRVFEQTAEMVWQGIVEERYDGCGTCELCSPTETYAMEMAMPGARFRWDDEEIS